MIYVDHIKSYLDRSFALILIILLLPFFILFFIILIISQGMPIFFVQRRSGQHMEMFKLIKFRTLVDSGKYDLSIQDKKFTLLGKFMRRIGIDELPQLVNILKGEMSFVGPRPMPIEYDNLYNLEHKKRFKTKPGLTGLAQVNGKNNISWGRRFELDILYVSNVNISLDLKILLLTFGQLIKSIFGKNGSNREMPVFDGTNLS